MRKCYKIYIHRYYISSITAKNKVEYRSYTYDNLNQLTRENNKTSNTTTLFTYDGIGNIKTKKVYGYTTGTVGALTKNVIYRYGNDGKSGWNNLLTGVDLDGNGSYSSTETISYDAIGNPTSYLGNSLTWFGRQLTGYNSNITYTYDADGYRASKTVNGQTTTYQYVNGMLVYECRPDMEIFYLYDSYNNLTGIRIYNSGSSSATNYYVTTNIQGDVLGIYNANGDKLAGYEYDAWGNVLSVTDANGNPITSETHIANINPFRYRGYYLDKETGLYYLNSRYYDAEVGRFISADTIDILSVQSNLYDKNLFAYCDNNPVGRIDVGGDAWETVFDVVSLGFSIAEVAMNPYDVKSWIGLVGDTIDLIPFVTGLGETVRGLRFVDKVGNTLEIVKAVDFTDDAADTIRLLDRSSGFTKSSRKLGVEIHKGYKSGSSFSKFNKEYNRFPGIRPDYYDGTTIFELKPFNPRSAKSGVNQLRKYNSLLGGNNILRLEFY